jgi:hypothetical protein
LGYCISALGRFFCIDQDTAKNTVYWSAPNNPDSFGVADFEVVYTDDGQFLTTLFGEQNYVYLGTPTIIYIMPMVVSADLLTIEPTGIYPTRARFGPLSPDGLTATPYGWYFIGFNGVYDFNGSDATLMSQEMRWFWKDSLSSEQLAQGAIVYDTYRDRLLVSVARTNSTENDVTLVYDFLTKQWGRYSFGGHHFQVLSYPGDEPRLYWADKDVSVGGVYRMDEGLTGDMGVSMSPYFTTGLLTLGNLPGSRVRLSEWFLESRRGSAANIALSVFVDGSSTALHVDSAQTGTSGWQVDRVAFPLAGLSGNKFQFKLQATNADTCEITGLRIDHLPEGEVNPQ